MCRTRRASPARPCAEGSVADAGSAARAYHAEISGVVVDATTAQLTNYSYRVRATDAGGNVSNPSVATSVMTPDGIKPSAPAGLSAGVASPTQVNLTWTASTENAVCVTLGPTVALAMVADAIFVETCANTDWPDANANKAHKNIFVKNLIDLNIFIQLQPAYIPTFLIVQPKARVDFSAIGLPASEVSNAARKYGLVTLLPDLSLSIAP